MNSPQVHTLTHRHELSAKFLAGDGIEIGALHEPLPVPEGARVRYVDRLTKPMLREHYPELASLPLVDIDIVDDGETLSSIADGSLDFIIANHMLEHCENPLGAVRTHLRKIRPGGVLYYAVPDKRFTFDAERSLTTTGHFIADDTLGPDASRPGHFDEWVQLVEKVTDPDEARTRAEHLNAINYSIHFHVWDFESFMYFVDLVRKRSPALDFDWNHIGLHGLEIVSIFTKR